MQAHVLGIFHLHAQAGAVRDLGGEAHHETLGAGGVVEVKKKGTIFNVTKTDKS